MLLTDTDKQALEAKILSGCTQEELRKIQWLVDLDREERAKEEFSLFSENYIKITNKKGQTVPLKQNFVQEQIHNKIKELQKQGIPPRLIILKSRQMGASTGIQGRMIFQTCTKENRNGFIVSHEEESTKAIFQKAKYMYDYLPDNIKPLQKASNAQELIFDVPLHYSGDKKGLHSKIEIKTAGNSGIGRSETRHYVHLSEYAFWKGSDANAPDKQLSGILQAVPDDVDTWVIIESTANGINSFYDLWKAAEKGENGFIPLFFPWYVHEEYQTTVYEHEKSEFIKSMSEYERWLYNDMNLSLEKVKWWRDTKKVKCNNDLNQMKQENPTTADEAFIFSGTPIFNTDKIMQHKAKLELYYKTNPPLQGEFIITWNNPDMMDYPVAYKWSNKQTGCIKIYEDVKVGFPYVIGGDTKGDGSDRFSGTVKNNNTGKRCASLHWPGAKSKYYSAQMWALGMYYNIALIAIETNFNTYPVELLTDWHYPRQYQREMKDKFTGELKKSYGWKTDGNTRPLIIEKEITEVEENIDNFTDIETLNEMLTFVDKDGRADAQSGKHDDLLISDMITNDIGNQQTHVVEKVDEDILDDDDLEEKSGSSWFD